MRSLQKRRKNIAQTKSIQRYTTMISKTLQSRSTSTSSQKWLKIEKLKEKRKYKRIIVITN